MSYKYANPNPPFIRASQMPQPKPKLQDEIKEGWCPNTGELSFVIKFKTATEEKTLVSSGLRKCMASIGARGFCNWNCVPEAYTDPATYNRCDANKLKEAQK